MRETPKTRATALIGLLLALCAPLQLASQSRTSMARTATIGPAERAPTSVGLDIPVTPRVVSRRPGAHGPLRVPPGNSDLPQPASAPLRLGSGPGGPCDVRTFVDRAVTPTPARRLTIGEPSVACNDHVSFYTGNIYAALSTDAGMSWSHVNPFTNFPMLGGFCCDQRVLYVPEHDMTVWFLQYDVDWRTDQNAIRIAVSTSRANLANNIWQSWVLEPSHIDEPAGTMFDFPDLAHSDDHLYVSSNVFNNSSNSLRTAVVFKMPLADLDAGSLTRIKYWKREELGGVGAYRLAQGAGSTMRWGAHKDLGTMRVFRNDDASDVAHSDDRGIATWNQGPYDAALAPNGSRWTSRNDGRILAGYDRGSDYGFLFTAGPQSGRPQPYLRVVKFNASDHSVLGEEDLWSNDLAAVYPATAVNPRGDIGLVFALGDATGSGTLHPTAAVQVVTRGSCHPNFGGAVTIPFFGDASPSADKWGDYLGIQAHSKHPNTFVAAAMTQRGTGGDLNSEPHYTWFGLETDTPPSVQLTVDSALSVPIAIDQTDLDGNGNGVPTFTRRFMQGQPYTLTAPLTYEAGERTWRFCRWRYRTSPTSGWRDHLDGETVLAIESIGTTDDMAIPLYETVTTVQIGSRLPDAGAAISVDQPDLSGRVGGITPFEFSFKAGSVVQVVAPFMLNELPFRVWIVNGQERQIGDPILDLTIDDQTMSLVAEYCGAMPGSHEPFGTGCIGSNGQIPTLLSDSQPDIGTTITHEVAGFFGATSAALFLGYSKDLWNGVPLPLSLGIIGADPSCKLHAAGSVVLPFAIDATGRGQRKIPLASTPAAVGTHFYTQVIGIDPGVDAPLKIIVSNGLDATIGGSRCP